jgi:hypothetical protein
MKIEKISLTDELRRIAREMCKAGQYCPSKYDADLLAKAAKVLAAAPPTLAWTTEPPTVPGWYMYRTPTGKRPFLVSVLAPEYQSSGHWYGPIPEPTPTHAGGTP